MTLLISISVFSQTVEIGTGTATGRFPLSAHFGYERSASLFTGAEIGFTGSISTLSWQANTAKATARPIKIYLKEVTQNSLVVQNWATLITGATLVYDGSSSISTGWNSFFLTTAFNYSGGTNNLLVLVETNYGGGGAGDGSSGTSIRYSSATSKILTTAQDNSMPTGNLTLGSNRPNIQIQFGPLVTCFPPTLINVNSITTSGATLNWTVSTSLPSDGYIYEVRTDTNPGVAGPALIVSGTTSAGVTTANVSTLSANTLYNVYVKSNCGSGDLSGWSAVSTFYTLCLPITSLPYTENFDSYAVGAFPQCWLRPIIYNGYPSVVAAYPVSTPNTLRFQSLTTAPTYAITPAFSQNIETLRVKFKLKREGQSSGQILVGVLSNPNDVNSFVLIQSITPVDNNMNEYTIAFDNSTVTGTNKAIAFKHVSNASNYFYWLDDVVVELVPPCPDFSSVITVSNVTKNDAKISWNGITPEPANGYTYEIRTSGLPGEPGAIQTGAVPAGVNFKDIVGLLPLTDYFVYVRMSCSGTQFGQWSISKTFKTLCDYPELTSAPPVTRCGVGTVELSATFDSGTVKWFTTQTGGTTIGTGNTLTSPTINTTTSFWVQSSVVGGISSSGLPAPLSNGTYNGTDTGIVFSVLESVQLQSVSVYSLGAGTINIQIVNSSGVQLYETGTVNIVAGGITTPNVVPLDYTVAPGTGYRMLIKAHSASVSLVRDSSIGGFPYNGTDGLLNVTNGYITGTVGTTYYYFYDIEYIGNCVSPRTEVIATVTPAPALTLSSNSLEICEGQSALVTLTAGATDFDSFVWSPTEGVSGNQTTGWTFDPVVSTVYTLTSTQSAGSECANIVTLNVTVNPLPIFTPLAEEYDVCVGSVQELDINNISKFIIGTGTTTTTTTDVPTAFMNRWSQSKQQYIYTKDELNAIGIYSGEISYLAFQISSLGSAATNNNYTIKMKSVAQSSFATTTFLTDGFTTVFGPVNYTHTATGWQVFNFTTPFNWDGNSNILIELTQLGANSINNAETFYTLTSDNKGLGVQGGSALTDTSGAYITKRLNAKFRPDVQATVTWSPQTNLFLDQAATQPYTGSSVSKVYFKSDQDTSLAYTVNIVTDEGCAESTLTTVNVISVAEPIVSEQTFCEEIEVDDIIVTGLTVGADLNWYDSVTSTTPITSIATTGVYYVQQVLNNCVSTRVEVNININSISNAPATIANQNFCGSASVADLVATPLAGNTIGWFATEASSTPLISTTPLNTGDYYVAQFNGSCWSPKELVSVSVNPVPAAPVSVSQIFCGAHTLSEIDLGQDDNATLKWYASETATSDLPLTTQIVTTTYYVSQTIFGCESARVAVSMTVQDVLPAPVAPLTQLYCGTVSFAGLDATAAAGGVIGWFSTETSEIPLPSGQNVVTGTYYVSQYNGACWSPRVIVQVTVNSVPSVPNNTDLQLCGDYTFGQLTLGQSANSTLRWYSSSTATTAIVSTTPVVTGVYFVSQTIGGCESARVAINVTATETLNMPNAVSQSFCGGATVADLIATGAQGTQILWYSSANSLNPLASNTPLVSGSYYAAQTKNGCVSPRKAIAVTVNTMNGPTVSPFNFCGSATVANLFIVAPTGVTYKWFNSPTSTTELLPNSALITGTYFVSRVQNNCESNRTAVSVTIHSLPNAPTGIAMQSFNEGQTINDIVLDQQNITWYITIEDAQNGVNPLSSGMPLVNGTTYYAVIIGTNGCPSLPFAVTVEVILSNNEFVKNELKYYPNPVKDILSISYTERILQIEVFDLLGKRVKSKLTDDKEVSIDLADLSSGTYMIQLKTDSKQQFIKVVKK